MLSRAAKRRDLTPHVDNELYDRWADTWWSEDSFLYLLKSMLNPWRVPFFKRILAQLNIDPRSACALDVGCGGGLLTEELAALGLAVTGVDPSKRSLAVAQAHAQQSGLPIDYRFGVGQALPFESESFHVAFCCDTLEHIENWDAVIGEIARVLKPNGILFYDTINRTATSKIRSIKMAQEWAWTRFEPPNVHAWEMFIQPEELHASLERHGLQNGACVGTAPRGNLLRALVLTAQYKIGGISIAEYGRRVGMVEGDVMSGSYMGYALKPQRVYQESGSATHRSH